MFAIILLRANIDYFWAISLDKHHVRLHTHADAWHKRIFSRILDSWTYQNAHKSKTLNEITLHASTANGVHTAFRFNDESFYRFDSSAKTCLLCIVKKKSIKCIPFSAHYYFCFIRRWYIEWHHCSVLIVNVHLIYVEHLTHKVNAKNGYITTSIWMCSIICAKYVTHYCSRWWCILFGRFM